MPDPSGPAPLLRLTKEYADAILRTSLDAIVIMDSGGHFLEFNKAAEAVFGYTRAAVIGNLVADFIIPERHRESHQQGMARYLATGHGMVVNKRVEMPALRADGSEFPAEIAIIPVEGKTHVFIGFIRDISEQKKTEARLTFLLNELAHRSKNLLAVVQSVVNRTLRDHPGGGARDIIANRIGALARSHASLAADPSGAPLRKIVSEELEGFSNRIVMDGPDILLNASAAQSLALIVHELATNAVKYGALSRQTGAVHIRWRRGGAATPFSFEWRESDGPHVTAPTRSGFGRNVLERVAAAEFNTEPSIDFLPEGLVYRFGDFGVPEGH